MKKATLSFDGSLNDFLKPVRRYKVICLEFQGDQTTKHLAESLRVPHPEIGEVIVNGQQANLNYIVNDQDAIRFFPWKPVSLLFEDPVLFLLDNHLGKLATFLRILGFNSAYRNDYQDHELAHLAAQEDRILLTRDRGLLMRKMIRRGYCLRSLDPKEQLREVIDRFQLVQAIRPFQRCLRCNQNLKPVEKETIIDRLEPLTRKYFDEFHLCQACNQLYWKGSHYDHMQQFINEISREQ